MSRRVLIADDDALARAALRTIFDAHDDLEVVAEARDGVEAVEHAGRLHPDVVLLDIRMPNLDGLEAAPVDFSYGAYRTFQVTVRRIEELTRLSFGDLRDFDPLGRMEATAPAQEIAQLRQIAL